MLHTHPDAVEIVTAVKEFLEGEVMPATTGGLSFHSRVAANLLGVLERELQTGAEAEQRFGELLASLICATEDELARRVRDGEIAIDDEQLVAVLRSITTARLAVSNPKYLDAPTDDDPRSV
jgi:hypothetical protein